MKLEKIVIENYGCIKDLNYQLPFNEDGTPKPVVIIGRNGAGKTLLLSNIIHSLIEFKRKHYSIIQEVSEDKYYRVGSKKYIKNDEIFSYINYQFSDGDYYTHLMTNNYSEFRNNYFNVEKHKNVDINNDRLVSNGFYYNNKQEDKSKFDRNIFLYFPVDRYYIPTWLNKSNSKLEFNENQDGFIGENDVDMIKNNVLEDIEKWILDVIIDKLLYEQSTRDLNLSNDKELIFIKQVITYSGKNNNIQNKLNEVLSKILTCSQANYQSARFGISKKENRKISIILTMNDGTEKEYVPNFSNLSSGEIMVLSIFASILKEYDRVTGNSIINFSDVHGIVIIDEIDAHLHSDFCKVVLPEIMKIFTGIQFIVSSHSPFFLLGMKESFGDRCEFLNLPEGIINNLDNFYEIKNLYELVYEDYEKTLFELKKHREKLIDIQKPLVITEGKTDWKHLKNALDIFKQQGKFQNLDISFFEYEEEMGDSNLEKLLTNIAKIPNHHKIIGLFDNDEQTGQKYDKDSPTYIGNNVYGWCIPNPRELSYGISIEFLYEDNDIKKYDKENRRLYLSDEFKEKNLQLKTDSTINTINKKIVECYKKKVVKIIDCDVFDSDEKSLALSKNDFAQNILDRIEPFDSVDVKHFEKVFERIQEILNK